MANSPKGVTGPAPGEDPWEFEWPDDAKELRQAEREASEKRAEINPAPRFFTAYLLGVWTVLAFVLAVTFYAPTLFISLVTPIAVFGLGALLVGMALYAFTDQLRKGVYGLIYVLAGGVYGYIWSYVIVTWVLDQGGIEFDSAHSSDRIAVAMLFMTATATAFFLARTYTDSLRYKPKAVFIAAGSLAFLLIPSTISLIHDFSTLL